MSLKKHEIKIAEKDIHKLLEKIGEEVVVCEKLEDDTSFCNPTYTITSKTGNEYILKVINPLDKWKKKKTKLVYRQI